MDYKEIDHNIFCNAMKLSAEKGWQNFTLIEAGKQAGIPLETIRKRFPYKTALLLHLNCLADQSALREDNNQQPIPDYLFDSLMRRFDVFQTYREGIISFAHYLPFNPPLALFLNLTMQNSMRWIAEAAGINTNGIKGIICIKGLTAIWIYSVKSWIKDTTEDLSVTMATLDQAIKRAGSIAPYFVRENSIPMPKQADYDS